MRCLSRSFHSPVSVVPMWSEGSESLATMSVPLAGHGLLVRSVHAFASQPVGWEDDDDEDDEDFADDDEDLDLGDDEDDDFFEDDDEEVDDDEDVEEE